MIQKRNLINMLSGGIGFIIPMGLNLIFTPFIVNKLGNQGYGLQNLVNILIGYLMVADMGLDIPITKLVSKYKTENNNLKLDKVIQTTFQIYFYIGLFGATLLLVFNKWLVLNYFKISTDLVDDALMIFSLTAFGFLASLVNMWGKAIFNGLQRYEISNLISILQSVGALLSGVLFIWMGYGVLGFVFAKILFIGLAGLIYMFIVFRNLVLEKFQLRLDEETWLHLKSQIGYGVILRLSGFFFIRLDQTFIAAFIGVASVGLYALPLLIANSLSSLLASLTHFTFPKVVELQTSQRTEELNSLFLKSSKFISLISSFLFLPFISFGGRFLSLWINPEAGETLSTVSFLICLGMYLNSLSNIILNVFIVGLGFLNKLTIYFLIRGICQAILYYFLIKFYGLNGAGTAILAVFIIDIVFLNRALKRYLKIARVKFYLEVYLKPLLITSLLIIAGYFIQDNIDSWITFVLASGSISLIFIILLVLSGYFSKAELKLGTELLSTGYNKLKRSV